MNRFLDNAAIVEENNTEQKDSQWLVLFNLLYIYLPNFGGNFKE